jgi:hypothetical protein
VTQATSGSHIADIDFQMLKGSDQRSVIVRGEQFRDGHGFMTEAAVHADQLSFESFGKYLVEGKLNVDSRGEREIPAGGDQLLQALLSEVASQLVSDKWDSGFLSSGFHSGILA